AALQSLYGEAFSPADRAQTSLVRCGRENRRGTIRDSSGRLAQLGERRVRNAEVGSSSLLPSTKILSKRGSFGCLFSLYGSLWTNCGQIERVERGNTPFERRMRVALEH